MCSLSFRSIGLALQILELRVSTTKNRVYSDNYSSYKNSLCQVFENLHQMMVALTDLKQKELEIQFIYNLFYKKQRNYAETKVKN